MIEPQNYTGEMKRMYNIFLGVGMSEADDYFHTELRISRAPLTDEDILAYYERRSRGRSKLYKDVKMWADIRHFTMTTDLLVAAKRGLIDGFRVNFEEYTKNPNAYSGYRDMHGEYSKDDLRKLGW